MTCRDWDHPPAPVKACITAIVDQDVEGLAIEFLEEPAPHERSRLVRETYEALYNTALVGPIAHGMDVHPLDLRTDSPSCPTPEDLRAFFSSFARARCRVEAHVHADGHAEFGLQRIGGPGDTVKPGEGMAFFDRTAAVFAAALLEEIGQR